jgi:hypothetical protein
VQEREVEGGGWRRERLEISYATAHSLQGCALRVYIHVHNHTHAHTNT